MENTTPEKSDNPEEPRPPYVETPEDVRKFRKQWLRGPDFEEEEMDAFEQWLRNLDR